MQKSDSFGVRSRRHTWSHRSRGAVDANHFLQVAARSLTHEVRTALDAAATDAEHRLLQAFLRARQRTTASLAAAEPIMAGDS